MQNQQWIQNESDLEADSFEMETNDEVESGAQIEGTLSETEEMELAAELMTVSSEEELDQFLGKFFKKAWKGIRKIARPLGGILKGIAKKALPFVGGALGSFIPIPGVGTALGSAIGGAASKLLEVDLEGMSPEDQEFELARRFVRLASNAAAQAAAQGDTEESGVSPQVAAVSAVRTASNQLAGNPPAVRKKPRQQSGRWLRRGNKIVLFGV